MKTLLTKTENYNKNKLLEKINNFDALINDNLLITKKEDNTLCENVISKKYNLIKTNKIIPNVIDNIEEVFMPQKMYYKNNKGSDELLLLGNEINIANDNFFEALYFNNSTNKQKKLMFTIGLLRSICSNGTFLGLGNLSYFSKHYNAANETINNINNSIIMFKSTNYLYEVKENINKLNNNYIKYNNFIEIIRERNIGHNSKINLIKKVNNRLLYSKSDKLNSLNSSYVKDNKYLLKNYEKCYTEPPKIDINAYTFYNAYMEGFRNLSFNKIYNENNFIFNSLNKIIND